MDANRILKADLLDLVFENRNKEYGAYELRKTYNRRITIALAGMLGLLVFFFVANALSNAIASDDVAKLDVKEVELTNIEEEEKLGRPPIRFGFGTSHSKGTVGGEGKYWLSTVTTGIF